jgi:hypothetical protein
MLNKFKEIYYKFKEIYWQDILVVFGYFIIILFVLSMFYLICIWSPINIYVESQCLKHGFPDSNTTWSFKGYCTREINNTQYVCRLSEITSDSCPISELP